MISDWLKTQKKPPRTKKIRAVSTTKFKKMAMLFSRRRKKTIQKFNNMFEKPEDSKKYAFLAKYVLKMWCKEKNTVIKKENEPEKLKHNLLITDYAKVKKTKNMQRRWQSHANQNSFHFSSIFKNEQGYKFSMITTGISSHVHYLLEEKGLRLLSLSHCGAKTSPYCMRLWSVFSTSVANETENLNIWSNLNQRAKIP